MEKRQSRWPSVKKEIRRDGTHRWRVDARHTINGRTYGRRLWFKTANAANEAARQARITRRSNGLHVFSLSREQISEFDRATNLLDPFGASLSDAAEFYALHLQEKEAIKGITVAEVIEEFLDHPSRRIYGGNSQRYQEDLRSRLYRFSGDFGKSAIRDITPRELDDWLAAIVIVRPGKNFGNSVSPLTRVNFRRLLCVLFNFAVRQGYCDRNPVEQTMRIRVPESEVGILTPEQTELLLNFADDEMRAYFAIGAFAGLRRSEIERLDWSEVDLEGRLIEVSAKKAKSASRRFVEISENLVSWLEPLKHEGGPLCASRERIQNRLQEIREEAGIIEWPRNALRHSFASYHLAKHRDAAALALELGHTTTNLIFRHYRRLVRPVDAERYWSIRPSDQLSFSTD